jgi:NAD kinase
MSSSSSTPLTTFVSDTFGIIIARTVRSKGIEADSIRISGTDGELSVRSNVALQGQNVIVGTHTGQLGFYGAAPVSKQELQKLDTVFGTPSLYDTALKVNELIEKLSNLGLMAIS